MDTTTDLVPTEQLAPAVDANYSTQDLHRAVQYLIWREEDRLTIEQIGERWKVTRRTVYHWLEKWKENGAFERAEQLFLVPKEEEIRIAINEVLADFPDVLRKQLKTAKAGKSEFVSLQAATWLHKEIVQPTLDNQVKDGSAEAAYANRPPDFDPQTTIINATVRVKETTSPVAEDTPLDSD